MKFKHLFKKPSKKIEFMSRSFSQESEDCILSSIFVGNDLGFYVDVGAHSPFRFSNTQVFYEKGWRGINIEPCYEGYAEFLKERTSDINLNLGVSSAKETLTYYMLNEPALNTFDPVLAKKYDKSPLYNIVSTKKVQTLSLKSILARYMPSDTKIDFMSIDVEGLDLEVLKSNDWNAYRPSILLVEESGLLDLESITNSKIVTYMQENNYHCFAKTYNTLFFREGNYSI